MNHSEQLFKEAKSLIPGGVNSPVRAFGAVGMNPIFIKSAKGSSLTDVDGNNYTDYVGSWGPMILGHSHPEVLKAVTKTAQKGLSFGAPCELEVELARIVCRMTGVDMVRMVSSGTEAVMSAVRLARAYTGKDIIVKFEGCYHGHADSMLIKAGSGAMTMGVPSSSGVTQNATKDTVVTNYNDSQSVKEIFEKYKNQIAGIIVEPVAANMGVVPPEAGFLEFLRDITKENESLLIFDEVITGFRLCAGGAQEYYGIKADLVTYGKIIGGGMPVGAYGGKREIMEMVAPLGPVYQAGTLSGNPVAMAAGIAQLSILEESPEIYRHIGNMGKMLAEGFRGIGARLGAPVVVNRVESLCCMFFTGDNVSRYSAALKADTKKYGEYFRGMLARGYYLAPSQFEAMFVGMSHDEKTIEKTLFAAEEVLKTIY